jgi:hypothetical protein
LAVWRTNIFEHVCKGGPAGGGYSTVEDLLRFDQAMRSNKLVSAATRELMWSPKPGSPDDGSGFGLHGESGNRVAGHNGGFPGEGGSLATQLDTGYTLAVLANYDGGAEVVQQKVQSLPGGTRQHSDNRRLADPERRPRQGVRISRREVLTPCRATPMIPFFSDTRNLERIVPPFLRLQVTTPGPIEVSAGIPSDIVPGMSWHGVC